MKTTSKYLIAAAIAVLCGLSVKAAPITKGDLPDGTPLLDSSDPFGFGYSLWVNGTEYKWTNQPHVVVSSVSHADTAAYASEASHATNADSAAVLTGAQAATLATALQPPATNGLLRYESDPVALAVLATNRVQRLWDGSNHWYEVSGKTVTEYWLGVQTNIIGDADFSDSDQHYFYPHSEVWPVSGWTLEYADNFNGDSGWLLQSPGNGNWLSHDNAYPKNFYVAANASGTCQIYITGTNSVTRYLSDTDPALLVSAVNGKVSIQSGVSTNQTLVNPSIAGGTLALTNIIDLTGSPHVYVPTQSTVGGKDAVNVDMMTALAANGVASYVTTNVLSGFSLSAPVVAGTNSTPAYGYITINSPTNGQTLSITAITPKIAKGTTIRGPAAVTRYLSYSESHPNSSLSVSIAFGITYDGTNVYSAKYPANAYSCALSVTNRAVFDASFDDIVLTNDAWVVFKTYVASQSNVSSVRLYCGDSVASMIYLKTLWTDVGTRGATNLVANGKAATYDVNTRTLDASGLITGGSGTNSIVETIVVSTNVIHVVPTSSVYGVNITSPCVISQDISGLSLATNQTATWTVKLNLSDWSATNNVTFADNMNLVVGEFTVTGCYEFACCVLCDGRVQMRQTYPTMYNWRATPWSARTTGDTAPYNGKFPSSLSYSTSEEGEFQFPARDGRLRFARVWIFQNISATNIIISCDSFYGWDSGNSFSKIITVPNNSIVSVQFSFFSDMNFNPLSGWNNAAEIRLHSIGYQLSGWCPEIREANELEFRAYMVGWRP